MPFGQLVIGSPGSGKTTYCHGLHQFLGALGRPISIINLDPANGKNLPYPCVIDISELITVADVMKELDLGPNGAMLYCMEYLEENFDWLQERLEKLGEGSYVAFDLPGQVELSTNHGSLKRIMERLQKMDWRLVAVHLLDASHITDASRYISLVLLSLRAMLTLELPHINVLSKVDLLGDAAGVRIDEQGDSENDVGSSESGKQATSGGLAFNLDYYTEVQDLSHLLDHLNSTLGPRRSQKFSQLNEKICEIIEDYGLVSFETLAVEDKRSMLRLMRVLDKAVGYVYVKGSEVGNVDRMRTEAEGLNEPGLPDANDPETAAYEPGSLAATTGSRRGTAASAAALFSVADTGVPEGWGSASDVQERWVDHRDAWEAYEARERQELERRWQEDARVEERAGGERAGTVYERR